MVLQLSRRKMKVRYDDVQDEDGYGNLEEWIPVYKVTKPDKLGMRCSGRPTIRPAPPDDQEDLSFDIGTAIDAWWSDGWWEGVVTGVDNSSTDNLQVYLPGESLFLNLHKKDLRISRDWVGDQWVDIEAKLDVLSVISQTFSLENKISLSPTIAKDVKSDLLDACTEVPITTKLDTVEEGDPNVAALACSDAFPEYMGCVNEKKPPSLEQVCEQSGDHEDARGDEVQDAQSNDGHENDDENGGEVDAEVIKTSGHDCRTTEVVMEVTA